MTWAQSTIHEVIGKYILQGTKKKEEREKKNFHREGNQPQNGKGVKSVFKVYMAVAIACSK